MDKKAQVWVDQSGRPINPNDPSYAETEFDPDLYNKLRDKMKMREAAYRKVDEKMKERREEEKKKEDGSGIDMKSWLPWATAGGAGLIGHSLVSSLFDGDPDSDRKNKSIWYRLLATLAPIAAGGASAYGGYLLGKHLNVEKTGQAQPDGTYGPRKHKFDVEKQYGRYKKEPLWRLAGAGLSLGATAGGAAIGWDQFKKWLSEKSFVPPNKEVVESVKANVNNLQERLRASEAELARAANRNPNLAASASQGAEAAVNTAMTSHGRRARIDAVNNAENLDRISKLNAPENPNIESPQQLREAIAREQERLNPVRNSQKSTYGKNAVGGGSVGLAGILGTLGFGKSLWDYYKTRSNLREDYENALIAIEEMQRNGTPIPTAPTPAPAQAK
jgi:hypothetical protein